MKLNATKTALADRLLLAVSSHPGGKVTNGCY
jgi:hypothetical protein